MKKYRCVVDKIFANTEESFRDELARLLFMYASIFKLDSKRALALFFANVLAEVRITKGGKVVTRENLNYSVDGLKKTFKFFRTHPRLAEKFGRNSKHRANQRAIANYAYAWRLGNRGPKSGDGWRYRGVGLLQDTGKDTISRDSKLLEEFLGIKVLNEKGEVYEGFLDSYLGAILLGFAYFYRSGMWKCKSIDCSVDIINRYTKSRAKRRKQYYRVLKKLKECDFE